MKLTAPVYILKQKAHALKQGEGIPLSAAFNRIAVSEGFASWSLLQAKAKEMKPRTTRDILAYLNPGDLVLIAARPQQGKTRLALELLLEAAREQRPAFFFSLEYTKKEAEGILQRMTSGNVEPLASLHLDFSDEISADYIIEETAEHLGESSLIGIDYLQLLDQARAKPPLQAQVEKLKAFAKEKGAIILFISQVDRKFEGAERAFPESVDIRLPNPLDLALFNKKLFLKDGEFRL
ncbi:MAG: DNA helicase [Alphaproteobacteria bacterium]|nr:MAG: DNA helicase [Alphaproteobacteria bacterium]